MNKLLKSEKKIRSKELKLSEAPCSAKGFEKAILVSQNSSFLWIKYAAFVKDSEGVDKAREVLKKAITQIDASQERERLNVSLALINLESAFGTDEDFGKAVAQSLASNNPEKILRHKAHKLLQKHSFEEAEETFRFLCRKYGTHIENWEDLLKFYMVSEKDEEKFEDTLRRATQALRDSLEIRIKVAKLYYENNSEEKGRTLFENLISEKPKRTDIWMVYIQLEEKVSSTEQVRDLYERVLSLKLSQKTATLISRKYYDYEICKKHKDKANEIAVRFNINI